MIPNNSSLWSSKSMLKEPYDYIKDTTKYNPEDLINNNLFIKKIIIDYQIIPTYNHLTIRNMNDRAALEFIFYYGFMDAITTGLKRKVQFSLSYYEISKKFEEMKVENVEDVKNDIMDLIK